MGFITKKKLPIAGFFLLMFLIFYFNGLHETYPDEFDNVLGGWYLLHGKLFYTDWFTHHGPVPYLISAFVNLFSFHSFVRFRLVYSVILLLYTFGTLGFLKSRIKDVDFSFYFYFILTLGLSATYFWGHMILADNVSAFLLLPVIALIFFKSLHNRNFDNKDLAFISLFSTLSLLSSLTYSFLTVGVYAYLLVYQYINRENDYTLLKPIKLIGIMLAPYLVFLLYLLLTGSLNYYYQEAIKFNRDYYIYYPGYPGKPPVNPLRYAIIIAQGFHNNFSSLLNQVRDFNFSFPFSIALAVGDTALGVYLLLKRKYLLFIFVLGVLIFANARTSPLDSRETDYQSAVYIILSLLFGAFTIPTLYKELNSTVEYSKKLILSGVFILLLIYSFFNFTFVLRKFSYKAYDKYMGFAARIYDKPKVAFFINTFETKNNVAWIGPFHYQDLYYLNAKLPSRFQVFLPGMGHSPAYSKEFLADFQKSKPDAIYFDKDIGILGFTPREYATGFINFLSDDYVTLGNYNKDGVSYKANYDQSVLLEQRLYINKDNADEIISKMLNKNLISPAE